ncbi:MAG: S-layer homology domain-containing protein [Firmicutes bacterium]|nr:S-layer homology domain-containing protein [Bacillota bacterium]
MKRNLFLKLVASVLSATLLCTSLGVVSYADEGDDSSYDDSYDDGYNDYVEPQYYSKSIPMQVGDGLDLTSYVSGAISSYEVWSDDSSIVSVSGGRYLAAEREGRTTVLAYSDTAVYEFNITVKANPALQDKIVTKNITAYVGDTLNLTGYTDQESMAYDWSSEDSSICRLESRGVVNCISSGSVRVNADAKSGGDSYIFVVTVKSSSSNYSYNDVKEKNITMYVDDSNDFSTYVRLSGNKYDWDTSDTSVATVSSTGTVRARSRGDVLIYAECKTSDDYDYLFYVTVKKSSSSSSSSSSSIDEKLTIYMGTNESVDVSDFLAKDANKYTWEVSDKSVCKVSGSNIKAVDTGDATVKALGGKNYQFNVKVNKKYSNYEVTVRADESLDIDKYLSNDISKYTYSYYTSGIAKIQNGELLGQKKGYTYVILQSKSTNEIVQLMVEVTAASQVKTTTKTTTEKTTEATTSKPVSNNNNNNNNNKNNTSQNSSFKDISHRAWAIPYIDSMVRKGFIKGRSNDVFAPDDNCSKADFSIVLVRMLGLENGDYSGGFDDVSSDKYYAKSVNIARSKGICAGVTGNNFKPQNAITREEAMYMVYKSLELKGEDLDTDRSVLSSYVDSNQIDEQYKSAVAALLNEGIIEGVSSSEIAPKTTITRAQMAKLLDVIDL